MPDYTEANAIKKITTGDEAGTWGASTNNNFDIIDRASNGYSNALNIQGLTGSGTASAPYELPQSTTAVLSDGHYKVIRFTSAGSLSSSTYLRLARDDKARMYMFLNATTGGQSLIIGQATGSLSGTTNATIANGKSAIVLADGAGSTSSTVIDFSALIGGIAELDVTAGTVTASKAVVVDSNKDITGFRNVTLTGELDAATLDISGDADIDGTLEADAITVNGTALSSVIAGTTVTNATSAEGVSKSGDVTLTSTAGDVTISATASSQTINLDTDAAGSINIKRDGTTVGQITTSSDTINLVKVENISSTTASTDLSLIATNDVILQANSGSIKFRNSDANGPDTINFDIDSSGNATLGPATNLYLKASSDVHLDANGDQIFLSNNGTKRGNIDVGTSGTLGFRIGSSGTGTERMRLTDSGSGTGLGLTIGQGLYVGSLTGSLANDEIRADGNITANYGSDISLKENIVVIENAVSKINAIRGVNFDWTDEHIASRGGEDGYFVRKKDVGVIAQEVEKVLPEVVGERKDGTKTVDYQKMVSLLVEGIKELSSEIEKLKGSI